MPGKWRPFYSRPQCGKINAISHSGQWAKWKNCFFSPCWGVGIHRHQLCYAVWLHGAAIYHWVGTESYRYGTASRIPLYMYKGMAQIRVGFLPGEMYFLQDTGKKLENSYFFSCFWKKKWRNGRNWKTLKKINKVTLDIFKMGSHNHIGGMMDDDDGWWMMMMMMMMMIFSFFHFLQYGQKKPISSGALFSTEFFFHKKIAKWIWVCIM